MGRDAETATRLLGEHIRLTLQSVSLDKAATASH
jgi:GntR family carbon starvation induced transcriptional regulator